MKADTTCRAGRGGKLLSRLERCINQLLQPPPWCRAHRNFTAGPDLNEMNA